MSSCVEFYMVKSSKRIPQNRSGVPRIPKYHVMKSHKYTQVKKQLKIYNPIKAVKNKIIFSP